ncbi:MAG: MarR family winged helix-turn-helix transcriptional regulator [Bacteroidota bacterium]
MDGDRIFGAIKGLTASYEKFYSERFAGDAFDMQAFAVWLYRQEEIKLKSAYHKEHKAHFAAGEDKHNSAEVLAGIEDQISFILLNMHKLIKFYVKKALEGTQLVGADDMHFLIFLSETDSMKKSEIISSSISEMSSGIEIIRRLLRKGLIEDFDDPDDKRSSRVRITKKGMKELTKVTSKFENIHRLLASIMSEEEKFSMLGILNKIYNFHMHIYNTEKNSTLEELFNKHLPKE